MSPELAQRLLALAGVALLSVLVLLAFTSSDSSGGKTKTSRQPVSVNWYEALAAPRTGPYGGRSDCGQILQRTTVGVAHPVLPCGAKIFIAFGGKQVLTEIVDHGPDSPGLEFELTAALARELDLRGVQPIRWSYARA